MKILKFNNTEKLQLAINKYEEFKINAEKKQALTMELGLTAIFIIFVILGKYWFDSKKYKNEFLRVHTKLLFDNFEQQTLLLESYSIIADGEKVLREDIQIKHPEVSFEIIRDRFEIQRRQINKLFAYWSKNKLLRSPNGRKALLHLNSEDLCIMHMSSLKYSNEKISHMLGYTYNPRYTENRKSVIQDILRESKVQDHSPKR